MNLLTASYAFSNLQFTIYNDFIRQKLIMCNGIFENLRHPMSSQNQIKKMEDISAFHSLNFKKTIKK